MREIIEQRPITIPEVKAILDKLKAERADDFQEPNVVPTEGAEGAEALELSETGDKRFYLQSTHEYANLFSKMEARVAKNVVSKLVEEDGVERHIAIQIVNINADTVEELALLFEKAQKRLSKEDLESLLFKIREYKEL